ncbi:MAG: PfkB family carbohydrate kinase, partial [Pseudomonadota bacterium]
MSLDALIIGRAGMDLYPLPAGTKTADAESFRSDMGGSSGNIAAAMARLGARVGLAAPVSDDPVGRFVRRTLGEFGIEHLTPDPVPGEPRTSLALAELIDEGSETVIYRNNAADFHLNAVDLAPHLGRARLIVATGTALAAEPSRSTTVAALKAGQSVLDLDYRPYSWASREAATETYAEAAAHADILVGNDEEFAILAGSADPRDYAANLPQTVLFKEGAAGCTLFQPGEAPSFLPAFEVQALKHFGAGDAFLGGTLAGYLAGLSLEDAMVRGAAGAALVVTRPGC